MKLSALSAGVISTLVGCATQAQQWPAWVINPDSKDGLVGTDCVVSSGNISLDRQHAATNARRNIAQEMEVGVKGMDESYAERTSSGQSASSRTTFQSKALAIIDTTLKNSKVTRVEEFRNSKGEWVCAQVSLQPSEVRAFVSQVVSASGEQVSPQTEDILLEQFRSRAAKAQMKPN